MSRRGLTLLELLLALALLSGLAAISVTWTASSISSSRGIQERVRWMTAATAALDLLGDDLRFGDVSHRWLDDHGMPAWIDFEGSALAVQARTPPYSEEERVRYELDSVTGHLSRSVVGGRLDQTESRALIGEVTRFSTRLLSTPGDGRASAFLSVELVSNGGWTVSREFGLESSVDQ